MALTHSWTDPNTGTTYPNAYARIEAAPLQLKPFPVASLHVAIYRDAAATAEGRRPVWQSTYEIADRPALAHVERAMDGTETIVVDVPASTAMTDYLLAASPAGLPLQVMATRAYMFLKERRPEFAGWADA